MQKFSRRARLKVGIIFRRSWLSSRLIRDHTDCFSGCREAALRDAGEGAPQSQTDRNEDVDGIGMRYIMRRFTRRAWPKV
jgi:hypothetical protein